MSGIDTTTIISDVLSGSSDNLRTAIGATWNITTNGLKSYATFNSVDLNRIDSYVLQAVYNNPENSTTGSFLYPNITVPVRIVGNESTIRDHKEWERIILGGMFANRQYNNIFSEDVFENVAFNYEAPYPMIEANSLGGIASKIIEIGYNYRQYVSSYQNNISLQRTTEHEIYNHYIATDLSKWNGNPLSVQSLGRDVTQGIFGKVGEVYAPELLNYISREENYSQIFQLNDFDSDSLPYKTSDIRALGSNFNSKIRTDNTYLTNDYMPNAFTKYALSASTVDWVRSRFNNMLFDTEAVNELLNSTADPLYKCAPYDVNINFPLDPKEGSTLLGFINDNNFSSKFLKTLYHAFDGNVEQAQLASQDFVNATEFRSSSASGVNNTRYQTDEVKLREIEYDKLLVYCRNNYDTTGQNENCMFVGQTNIARASAQAESDKYRFFNTATSTRVLRDTINYVNTNFFDKETLGDIYHTSNNYFETLAYRIEKIGGTTTSDSRTQNVLQNFWLMKPAEENIFNFHDTQVKYGTEYTYTVYAYVLVVGTRYSASDLILSRDLGCEDGDYVGVEMYDPSTGESVPEIFESSNFTVNTEDEGEIGFSRLPFKPRTDTGYGETYQILTQFPYIADFKMKYQPVMKIIEVPVYTKTLSVLDHPGNRLQVRPYQVMNDSQKIGFEATYNSFNESVAFPGVINADDRRYKERYLRSNDLTEKSELIHETVANPRFVQIYRLDKMPTSLTSFDGSLIATIDLKIPNENKYTFKNTYYDDRIATNKKYYYLLRVLNQQRVISHLTEIYEAQLVNDGGYNYVVFNTIEERELSEDKFKTVSKPAKKIFQLQPNMSQLAYKLDDVDFGEDASTQIDNVIVGQAEDLIWDKTFKIRLTSRKTGRKVDLNITYKLNSE